MGNCPDSKPVVMVEPFSAAISGSYCGQRVHIQLSVYRYELLLCPVEAVLRPDEEAPVQLDRPLEDDGLVRVNAQLAVDHCLFVDYCRQ